MISFHILYRSFMVACIETYNMKKVILEFTIMSSWYWSIIVIIIIYIYTYIISYITHIYIYHETMAPTCWDMNVAALHSYSSLLLRSAKPSSSHGGAWPEKMPVPLTPPASSAHGAEACPLGLEPWSFSAMAPWHHRPCAKSSPCWHHQPLGCWPPRRNMPGIPSSHWSESPWKESRRSPSPQHWPLCLRPCLSLTWWLYVTGCMVVSVILWCFHPWNIYIYINSATGLYLCRPVKVWEIFM